MLWRVCCVGGLDALKGLLCGLDGCFEGFVLGRVLWGGFDMWRFINNFISDMDTTLCKYEFFKDEFLIQFFVLSIVFISSIFSIEFLITNISSHLPTAVICFQSDPNYFSKHKEHWINNTNHYMTLSRIDKSVEKYFILYKICIGHGTLIISHFCVTSYLTNLFVSVRNMVRTMTCLSW